MKTSQTLRAAGLAALLATGLAASAPALAQHHWHGGPRAHIGVVIGGPIWYPPPRYYYYPPPVVVRQPPVYIEQQPAPAASANVPPEMSAQADAASYWYYCRPSNTYYPYVKSCAAPWERVTPQAPAG